MTENLHFIFGDQLSHNLINLIHLDKKNDLVLMCEVKEEAAYASHHKKKIAFIFSAMRHFAQELEQKGIKVDYIKFDDDQNLHSFDQELARAIKKYCPKKIMLTEPSEYRVWQKVLTWQKNSAIPFEIFPDNRFLCSQAEFRAWAKDKKQLRLEFFYREMRKKYHILLDEKKQPTGGKWNYDAENRKKFNFEQKITKRISHKKDQITLDVIKLVEKNFADNFGDLTPFDFAVNRDQALIEAKQFFAEILPFYGDYQDAMVDSEPFLFHSLLSSYVNVGLLSPLELCKMAEESYHKGIADLNAVEGFIRQILGWREYVRGIYWLYMPKYQHLNFLNAQQKLPELFWGKKTAMRCLSDVVDQTKKYAYSHHIQRLMITGNFALLAAVNPIEVHQWYLAVYCDAFEWVEMPNTIGMAIYADGGIMASKPYAASGRYIDKMSNFCAKCSFNNKIAVGENACPFNSLYWNFINKNEDKLKKNPRMHFVYPTWYKMDEKKRREILSQADFYLKKIAKNEL